ncbi:IS30 family transposase [Streptomyces sp. NPDC057717]|uniref:IS30 family transposase n=1 Tax=unclassified Streptomyces TaxID=2593676 RepID=UPI0036575C08
MIKGRPFCRIPVAPHHCDVISREHLQHSRSPTAAQPADQTLLLHVNEARHSVPQVEDVGVRTVPAGARATFRAWARSSAASDHPRGHEDIEAFTGFGIYFCDPHSPWQRGTNENMNGLLRQCFPKGTDLSIHTAQTLRDVARQLNRRPCIVLGDKTPAEAMREWLTGPLTR